MLYAHFKVSCRNCSGEIGIITKGATPHLDERRLPDMAELRLSPWHRGPHPVQHLTYQSHTNILTANSLVDTYVGPAPTPHASVLSRDSFLPVLLLCPQPPSLLRSRTHRKACSEKRVTVIRRRPSNGWLPLFPPPVQTAPSATSAQDSSRRRRCKHNY